MAHIGMLMELGSWNVRTNIDGIDVGLIYT